MSLDNNTKISKYRMINMVIEYSLYCEVFYTPSSFPLALTKNSLEFPPN